MSHKTAQSNVHMSIPAIKVFAFEVDNEYNRFKL